MHGRVQQEGESTRSLRGGISQHMWSVPSLAANKRSIAVASDHSSVTSSTISTTSTNSESFFKDGRKISIGDCALFKPPQDTPPFIGIVRWLAVKKEKNLQLGVNWLYRPAELKLAKGIELDAAPNEIFYSFHKDEIPATSLLHPCKVAFLPKGVELPAGISSFICRRVYDVENNCLWWLNDQDYIDERQEEVDQLLDKTRRDMHATVQSGGPSPKTINCASSTMQSKSGPDNGQTSTSTFSPQVKGKKRERGDQGGDPIKRERHSKTDDAESGICRAENSLKSEIMKITGKGLLDSEGVEKFVQLMQPEKPDRKMDLTGRSLLVGVLAATDNFDCLNQFVKLRGLPVLDEWLQDIHKGKINGGNNSKDDDKSVEEFVLVLLRALEKLPVNLNALQMCYIGRSVNHLRSHKNSEIQKKARSLVDTWKKRVEAEIDAKSGSTQAVSPWPSKSRLPESSHGGNRNSNGSDVAMKGSNQLISASKTPSMKSSHGESIKKSSSSSSSPGPIKSISSPASGKDILPRVSVGSASDVLLSREEKSSSSVQSHSYNQSIGKDEVKGSGAGSMNVNKISGSGSRHRKATNGFSGTPVSGSLKETSSTRAPLMHKSTALEKSSQPPLNSDKVVEAPISESSNHKLIVKIPNFGQSPVRNLNKESSEDPSIMSSRASSPVHAEEDHIDRYMKGKSDAHKSNFTSDVNTEWCQSNEFKDGLTGSEEAVGSPATLPHEEQSRTTEVSGRIIEFSKTNDLNLREASFSPMNALIDSCVNYSEAKSLVSLEDDIGMNLLASVAAGEMSRSDLVSSTDSPERNNPAVDEVCPVDDAKSKSSPEDRNVGGQNVGLEYADGDSKTEVVAGTLLSEDGSHLSKHGSIECFGGRRCPSSLVIEDSLTRECSKQGNLARNDPRNAAEPGEDISEKSGEMRCSASLMPSVRMEKVRDGELIKNAEEKVVSSNANGDAILDGKLYSNFNLLSKGVVGHGLSNVGDVNRAAEVVSSHQSCDGNSNNDVKEELSTDFHTEKEQTIRVASPVMTERSDNEKLERSPSDKKVVSEKGNAFKVEKVDEKDSVNYVDQSETKNFNKVAEKPNIVDQGTSYLGSSDDLTSQNIDTKVENNEVAEHQSVLSPHQRESPSISSHEEQENTELRESKNPAVEAESVECASSVAEASSSSAATPPETDAKINFDLNEGFIADDVKCGETFNSMASDTTSVHVMNPLLSAVNSVSSGLPVSITVTAAAKGPFVPPEDLLRSRSEFGWKGSAATSAFRPAEPRKALELPLGLTDIPFSDASTSRHVHPFLDIDLNVPDERALGDIASRDSDLAVNSTSDFIANRSFTLNERIGAVPVRGSIAFDLDLNKVDEADEMGDCSSSSNFKVEDPAVAPVDSSCGAGDVRRDFDLNDGPVVDDASAEQFGTGIRDKGGMQSQLPSAGLRMNSLELGNFSSWFPPTYSTVTFPSMLPDRGDQPFPVVPAGAPQRVFSSTSGTQFTTADVYRGSVLSSSSAIPFPSTSFQYPVFPFGSPLSVGGTSYVDSSSGGRLFTAPVNSQFLGQVGGVTSQLPRSYQVSLPDGSSNGGLDHNRKWGRPGLDLNAGPGAIDLEGRDEMLPLASRQLSVASSQALAEEQARMQSVSGGIMKRKEPEGGWDNDHLRYKQSSWQ